MSVRCARFHGPHIGPADHVQPPSFVRLWQTAVGGASRGTTGDTLPCAVTRERWVGTCRREWLDHVMVLNHKHLQRLLQEFLSSNKRVV